MGEITYEYVKNKYNISIKKCCASCQHHTDGSNDRKRKCNKYATEHPADYCCNKGWELMHPSDPPKPGEINYDNAGRGDGFVKKPQYIKFVLEHGPGYADMYERRYGSRYMNKK